MISNDDIAVKLAGYPDELLQKYADFLARRKADDLNAFVVGLIQFLQDADVTQTASAYPDATRLQEDMGVDSITIAEVVFMLEDILEIEIDNEDLMRITSIGELRTYILERIS